MGGSLSKRVMDAKSTQTGKSPSMSPRTRSPEQLERDEKMRVARRVHEVLDPEFQWEDLGPTELCEIFTELLVNDSHKHSSNRHGEAAWANWRQKPRLTPSEMKLTSTSSGTTPSGENMIMWNPTVFEDAKTSTYANYFPCVIDRLDGLLAACDHNSKVWCGMLKLDFLPAGVNNIIAGDGGLLCVNGGIQPRLRNPKTPPIPYADDYNYVLYPRQSILTVCNPLTKEVKYIPRHSNKTMDAKIAWMQALVPPIEVTIPRVGGNAGITSMGSRSRYRLHIIGSHHNTPTLYKKGSHELVLMTYDSRADAWIFGSVVGRCRFSKSAGKTCMAFILEGFLLGGQEETDKVVMVKIEENRQLKKKNTYEGEEDEKPFVGKIPQDVLWQFRESRLWANKIFFIQSTTLRWHTMDFVIPEKEDPQWPRKDLQAPKILQCKPGGAVFAVTRSNLKPVTIEIYEVLVTSDGFPSGDFKLVTSMPTDIFRAMFGEEKSLKHYDCTAGKNMLCFLALEDHTPVTISMYEVTNGSWSKSPYLNPLSSPCSYAFAQCEWKPDWRARP